MTTQLDPRGWAGLGQMLAGGAPTTGVYEQRMTQLANTDRALEMAKRERDVNLARAALRNNPDLAPLAQQVIGGELGTDFNAYQQGTLNATKADALAQALAAATGDTPNVGLANLLTGISAGKPVEAIKLGPGGHVAYDAFGVNQVGGGDQFTNTPTTDAYLGTLFSEAGADNARATASYASAGNSNALAALNADKLANPERHRAPPRGSDPGNPYEQTKDYAEALQALADINRRRERDGLPALEVNLPPPTPAAPQNAPASAAPSSGVTVGDSPYPEGTIVEGPNSQLFIIQNGVPVPL